LISLLRLPLRRDVLWPLWRLSREG